MYKIWLTIGYGHTISIITPLLSVCLIYVGYINSAWRRKERLKISAVINKPDLNTELDDIASVFFIRCQGNLLKLITVRMIFFFKQ